MFILKTIILLGSVHGLFLGVAVFKKRKKGYSNFFLALWIISTSYLLFCTYLLLANVITRHMTYYFMIEFELFLGVVLFYLYTRFLTDINLRFKNTFILHLIPAFLSLIILLIYIIRSPSFLNTYYNYSFQSFLVCSVYFILGIRLLIKKRRGFHNWMITGKRKIWIFSIIIISIISWILSICIIVISVLIPTMIEYRHLIHGIIALLLSLEIYLLGYFALVHPVIFVDEIIDETDDEIIQDQSPDTKPYLPDEDTREEYTHLKVLMEKEKLFTDTELSLDELSFKAKIIPPHRLSQVIRKHEGINFSDFLNNYRVEEVKKLLVNEEYIKKSVLELAFTAGFNSKSTFNRVFKDKTGLTPTQYRLTNLSKK